jgi:hypothetical protein
MKIGHGEQLRLPLDDPSLSINSLAFWTVAISAAVVEILFVSTTVALALMSAKRCRSTARNGIQCFNHLKRLRVFS